MARAFRRCELLSLLLASAGLTACAATASESRAGATDQHNNLQDVSCRYVGLQDVSTSNDQNSDQASLLATYSFGEGVLPGKAPLALMFQVDRARVSELGDYLAAQPEVICSPEGGAYTAKVAPFGAVHGQPQR